VGGFSVALAVAYNDIDLCYRLRRRGLACIVVPAAMLLHHESASRGTDSGDAQRSRRLDRERMILYRRNPEARGVDPYHNPNLDQSDPNFLLPRRDAT
ncbi:MAG: glycosyltransferase family 2 protein, partial [Caldilineaceae bacterium]